MQGCRKNACRTREKFKQILPSKGLHPDPCPHPQFLGEVFYISVRERAPLHEEDVSVTAGERAPLPQGTEQPGGAMPCGREA